MARSTGRVTPTCYAFATLSSVGLVVLVLGLWHARLSIPLVYHWGGDPLFYQMLTKGLIDNGGYLENPYLGMPRGQELYDYPLADQLHLAALKLLSLVVPDAGAAVNLYFLATFPLTAVVALYALAELGLGAGSALVASLLFTFLPFHFTRGEFHLFLGAYYLVPLGALVAVWLSLGRPFVDLRGPHGRFSPRRLGRRGRLGAAFCFLLAAAGVYNAFFSSFLWLVGGVLGSLRRASLRPLWTASALIGLVFCLLVVNLSPSIVHGVTHGWNPLAGKRRANDAETYGLKISHLLLPVQDHRLPFLGKLHRDYARIFQGPFENENAGASLGALGSIGFLVLVGAALFRSARIRASGLLPCLASLNLAALLLATIGGFAPIFAFLVSPAIRGYNRMSVFLAFFACATLAWLLDALRRRWPDGWSRRLRFSPVLALVAALGVFDETSVGYVPDYPRAEAAYRSDADFVARIEASLPAGAMVFQLPYLPFYESPPLHRMQDYEPARFYLHSRELRWSYGAMKGREAAAWQEGVVRRPLPRALERVVLAGFAGLTVDRFGYADGGRETEKQIDAVAGPHAFTSADGRFVLYDLRPLADRLRQSLGEERSAESRAKALEPVAARAR